MKNSQLTQYLEDRDNLVRFQEETLLVEMASLIYRTMQKRGITRSELAERLGVTRGRVTQYLGGELNLRLRTLANILTALDCQLEPTVSDLSKDGWIMEEEKVCLPHRGWLPSDFSTEPNCLLGLAG